MYTYLESFSWALKLSVCRVSRDSYNTMLLVEFLMLHLTRLEMRVVIGHWLVLDTGHWTRDTIMVAMYIVYGPFVMLSDLS